MEQEQFDPVEILDRALAQKPGIGEPIEFFDLTERDSFRFRLFAAMSADARRSVRLDDPADSNWGKHRWGVVKIEPLGYKVLWIGRVADFVVGKPVSLEQARKAGKANGKADE